MPPTSGTPARSDLAASPIPAAPQDAGQLHVAGRSAPRTRDLRNSVLIFFCCLIIYNANLRGVAAGDTYPARYMPFAIWKHQTLRLDPIVPITAQGRGDTAFWMVRLRDGHTVSLYPVTLPLLIAPLYLPAVAYLQVKGWTDARLDHVARVMEKVSASLITSLCAALFYLLLRRRATGRLSLILTVAFALGTSTWMISSQALWQHGMAQLLIVAALLFLTGRCTPATLFGAGMMLGLVAANRPPDAIIAGALCAFGLFRAGRASGFLLAGAAFPAAGILAYNLGVTGNVLGGYGLVGNPEFFRNDLLHGIAGLLLSPTRGLLVFSPFLLFLVLAWRFLPRDRNERILTMTMAAAALVQLLIYAKTDWRAGVAWGPRFLTDLLPLLVWMLVPVATQLRGVLRAGFLASIAVAVAIEATGAVFYTGATDEPILAAKPEALRFAAAWEWRNAPFVAPLKNGPAPRDLTRWVRGALDTIAADGRDVSGVVPGMKVVASGWALQNESTPSEIVLMTHGRVLGTAWTFDERPDVTAAFGIDAPSGWQVSFETPAIRARNFWVTALVRSTDGPLYYLGSREMTVQRAGQGRSSKPGEGPAAAASLDAAFRTAARRVRNHQQPAGYWLTTFTSGTRYQNPHPEMNTFLTSFLVDLLTPVAEPAKLGGTLERARRHLTAQIEPGGLVRYHGLPFGPGMGVLGCAITPDTDDTALVWRVAPGPDRRQLDSALQTISQYRTSEGLYRTWLAPPEGYQCLNPGKDPNPPDIAIQMHLLMLLASERPDEARALCANLRRVAGQDRVWVYYSVTPLVAMLRLPDLARAGCAIELPPARMKTSVPEQQIWVDVVRRIIAEDAQRPADAASIRELLERLAADDFALLRKNPPLLYHNDLTASVSRYYWSEDFGYALWMRLARIHERIRRTDANS